MRVIRAFPVRSARPSASIARSNSPEKCSRHSAAVRPEKSGSLAHAKWARCSNAHGGTLYLTARVAALPRLHSIRCCRTLVGELNSPRSGVPWRGSHRCLGSSPRAAEVAHLSEKRQFPPTYSPLSIVPLHLCPPLRERRRPCPLLWALLLDHIAPHAQPKDPHSTICSDAMAGLARAAGLAGQCGSCRNNSSMNGC